ncbi:MAG: ATP-binding protein [Planctomycetaceae bacterium]|jgi:ABC-type transport system involved in cytochrome c biogenesis ATPase subunit|nr:ATP-binding protein [Planctomycetaceae bacterium]
MLKTLILKNVGPNAEMPPFEFGERLNILTGDNGLGKSFLLDIIWWTLTKTFPADINPLLTGGRAALPIRGKKGEITAMFSTKSKKLYPFTSSFDTKKQIWGVPQGRPTNPGIVLYAMSDGSFAVWDPARNYWETSPRKTERSHREPYVFSPKEIWDGLNDKDGTSLCNGIIRDWASWQKESKIPFENLKVLLEWLSPSTNELITPGELTRISLKDVRDMPTLRMPYRQDVPVVHASSGMRRIIALAYVLLWAWQEHRIAAHLIHETPSNQVVFLIDEIESHLHPRWQQSIVPTVMSVVEKLHKEAKVQLIAVTHSPLIMASIEPTFNAEKDAWFDFDYEDKKVTLTKRDFEKYGDANTWLSSPAFDLKSTRAIKFAEFINKASAMLEQKEPKQSEIQNIHSQLVQALNPEDDFLIRWQYVCQKKGWLK